MNLGVQYYRPPFPYQKYWEDDIKQMKDSGLDSVQLWLVWGWIESTPDVFNFDDFDQLVALADKHGLKVVLSTIAAIHPYWIHRVIPGSELVDHMGHRVISSNRCEVHNGLTPGGCFDHPQVWARMANFLRTTAEHYKDAPNVHGWDAWNELRWNVQADGYVCYCEHTVARFRNWLSEKYGGLDGLNQAWQRRYISWEDVQPGKQPDRPYTEMMAFQHFLTWRSDQHAIDRYRTIKEIVPDQIVTVHAAAPAPLLSGGRQVYNQAINRGNDWFMADAIDGVGTSSFPIWENIDDAAFGNRIDMVRSAAAAAGKHLWLSEVQGGRSATGFNLYDPVDAASQQRWIWNGIASGADTILFWCWRNEIFGRESGGFGLAGDDGLAQERLDAMRQTHAAIEEHSDLLADYHMNEGKVGVLFSPQSYYLHWSQEETADKAKQSLLGYCRALVRKSIPYRVIEEEHLEELSEIKVLFLPRMLVATPKIEAALSAFVEGGGTLVCESECGAFNPIGIYRYPEERFTAKLTGIKEIGRRNLIEQQVQAHYEGQTFPLHLTQWLTPWENTSGEVLCEHSEGAIISQMPVKAGKVILVGSYLGEAYFQDWYAGFEDFIAAICDASGCGAEVWATGETVRSDSFVYIKSGESQGKKVVFVFYPKEADTVTLQFAPGFLGASNLVDCVGGNVYPVNDELVIVNSPAQRVSVLVESEG